MGNLTNLLVTLLITAKPYWITDNPNASYQIITPRNTPNPRLLTTIFLKAIYQAARRVNCNRQHRLS